MSHPIKEPIEYDCTMQATEFSVKPDELPDFLRRLAKRIEADHVERLYVLWDNGRLRVAWTPVETPSSPTSG